MKNKMLTEGLINKKYNSMLIASFLGWLVGLVGELADSIIAGQFISETAVSATGLVAPLFNFNFFFSVMIGLGSANRYAIKSGRFEKDEAYRTAGQALVLSIGAGIIFSGLMFFGEDLVFSFYNAGPEVEALAREYYEGMIIVTLLAPPFWTFYYLVSVDGDSNAVLAADILQAIGNFAASLFFVNQMGIKGIALGTCVGLVLSWCMLIPHFFSKKNSIRFKPSFSFKCLRDVVFFGSTSAMTSVYIGIVDVVFNKFILLHYGAALLASYAIINLILNLAQVSTCAVDSGSGFIATAYAESNSVAMRRLLRMITRVMVIVSGCLMLFFLVFANYAPNVYGIVEPAAREAAVYATKVLALSYVPSAFIFMYLGYFPRIEKPFLGNLAGFLYSLFTPIAIAMPLGLISYNAMSWGFFATPSVTMLIMGVIIIKKFGKNSFPYPIPKTEAEKIFIHEFAVTDEEIVLVKDMVADELKTADVSESIINKLALMIEEALTVVKNQNTKIHPGKIILADATIMVFKDRVQLITRDNGVIFDITRVDEKLSSLEAYVAASLMNDNDENSYVTSVSFNRNLFCWER